jgi:3-deoxy-7-phosphoheptulonate synthase
MIIVLDHNIKHKDKQYILGFIKNHGLTAREIEGEQETILGVVGNVTLDSREVEILPGVSRVIPISSPYKLASREFKKEDTLVTVGPVKSAAGGSWLLPAPAPWNRGSRSWKPRGW